MSTCLKFWICILHGWFGDSEDLEASGHLGGPSANPFISSVPTALLGIPAQGSHLFNQASLPRAGSAT